MKIVYSIIQLSYKENIQMIKAIKDQKVDQEVDRKIILKNNQKYKQRERSSKM